MLDVGGVGATLVPLFIRVGEVLLEVLGHAEALLPLLAKDRLHRLVRREPLTVLRVLKKHQFILAKCRKLVREAFKN